MNIHTCGCKHQEHHLNIKLMRTSIHISIQ